MLLSNYFDTNATPLQCANNKGEGLRYQGEGLYHLQHNAKQQGEGATSSTTQC